MNEIVLSREKVLEDLLKFCNSFISRSYEWRKNSFETQWARWQRAADSIYEPEIKAKKESWQSTPVVPITASHLENAQAQLFKTEVGPRPPLEVKARPGVPPEMDQSENIRDLILREREKTRFEIERNKVIQDKLTYGSGFARMRFETVYDDRVIRVPIFEQPNVFDPTSLARHMAGQPQVLGYEDQVQKKVVYRGCRYEHISAWDFFPDPRALKIQGNPCAYRYETTYGEIVDGAQPQIDPQTGEEKPGYYIPEAAQALKDIGSEEQTPEDKRVVESDRAIADSKVERTDYGKRLQCFELFGRLPKKWVYINGEPIDDPEKLVPAVIRFHKLTVIAVELNDSYDGEPPIYKDDYIPVAGQFYGRGIPEMLKDVQSIATEVVGQRLDTGAIALRQRFAIIEKAIFDQNDIDENRNVIRIKNPSGINDIKQVMMRLDMGNVPGFAFLEPEFWERMAQERSSIGRTTLGTADQTKDANQTLGGMELLKAATGDKMAYIGMLSEFGHQYEVNRAFWKLIYQNYQPEDYALALGPERAANLIPMSPEEVENNYQYFPTGTYTAENKALKTIRYSQVDQQFGMMPWFNRVALAKAELQGMDEDPERFITPEAEAMQIMGKAQEIAAQQVAALEAQREQADIHSRKSKPAGGAVS